MPVLTSVTYSDFIAFDHFINHFYKVIYYKFHCHMLGEDEIILHDE